MRKFLICASFFSVILVHQEAAASGTTCKHIDEAISANEDFVEIALGIDTLPLPPAVAKIKSTLALVSGQMTPVALGQSKQQIASLEDQIASHNLPMAAVMAIEHYRTLITAFDQRLPTTFETAILDYVGFKLLGLTAANKVDWSSIASTVEISGVSWEKTRTLLKDQAIIDLVDSTQAGLSNAAKAKDAVWLSSVAQILLDSVDLIERESKNTSKLACK